MSRLPFELLLALRYLRPKRTFVSVITVISVLGVTLGVAVLIIVISVMTGFDSELREKVLGFNAHVRILQINPETLKKTTMQDYAMVENTVKSNADVVGVSPFALGKVMVETEGSNRDDLVDAPFLSSIDLDTPSTASIITSNMVAGECNVSGNGVIVGSDFAANMELRVGDRLAVYSPFDLKEARENYQKNKDTNEFRPSRDFEVRGIFDTGYQEFNLGMVCSLPNMQELYRLDDDVHGLVVMIKDPYQADRVAGELQHALGKKFAVQTWMEKNSLMDAVKVEKNMMLYILFCIVIVAAFGITCTLITFVVQKTREIGVIKALGGSNRQIMWVFLSQSLVVSLCGVGAGLGLGLLAVAYRNPFLHLMRRWTGMNLFPSDIYMFNELPARIIPGDILIICGGSLLICMLAAAFPAWNASRLKPVEALRHE
jgi:lipoprotein-releasing system permease protein